MEGCGRYSTYGVVLIMILSSPLSFLLWSCRSGRVVCRGLTDSSVSVEDLLAASGREERARITVAVIPNLGV